MQLPNHTDEFTEEDLSPLPRPAGGGTDAEDEEDEDDEDDIAELDDDVGTDEHGHETLKMRASPGQAT